MRRHEGPIVFLDRDGVLNDLVLDPSSGLHESPYSPEDVVVSDAAREAVSLLTSVDPFLIVVSNQPAAAKGTVSLAQLTSVHDEVMRAYQNAGLGFDLVRYCHHHPSGVVADLTCVCDCRKPAPGLLTRALVDLAPLRGVHDLWMVGDSDVDVLAGAAAGARTVLVEDPRSAHRRTGSLEPDHRVSSVLSAAKLLVAHSQRSVPEAHD